MVTLHVNITALYFNFNFFSISLAGASQKYQIITNIKAWIEIIFLKTTDKNRCQLILTGRHSVSNYAPTSSTSLGDKQYPAPANPTHPSPHQGLQISRWQANTNSV